MLLIFDFDATFTLRHTCYMQFSAHFHKEGAVSDEAFINEIRNNIAELEKQRELFIKLLDAGHKIAFGTYADPGFSRCVTGENRNHGKELVSRYLDIFFEHLPSEEQQYYKNQIQIVAFHPENETEYALKAKDADRNMAGKREHVRIILEDLAVDPGHDKVVVLLEDSKSNLVEFEKQAKEEPFNQYQFKSILVNHSQPGKGIVIQTEALIAELGINLDAPEFDEGPIDPPIEKEINVIPFAEKLQAFKDNHPRLIYNHDSLELQRSFAEFIQTLDIFELVKLSHAIGFGYRGAGDDGLLSELREESNPLRGLFSQFGRTTRSVSIAKTMKARAWELTEPYTFEKVDSGEKVLDFSNARDDAARLERAFDTIFNIKEKRYNDSEAKSSEEFNTQIKRARMGAV